MFSFIFKIPYSNSNFILLERILEYVWWKSHMGGGVFEFLPVQKKF